MIIKRHSRKTIKAKDPTFSNAFHEKLFYANEKEKMLNDDFKQTLSYIHDETKIIDCSIFHNLDTQHDDLYEIGQEFLDNYTRYHSKKLNRVVLYHYIISFPPLATPLLLQNPQIAQDIAAQWLKMYAPDCLGYGQLHFDKPHIHAHLIISGNVLGSEKQLRYKPCEFKKLQWQLELFKREQYPELPICDFYDPQRVRDRRKETVREQEMKRRQRNQGRVFGSRKEEISHIIQHCFDSLSVGSKADLVKELQKHELEFFERGRKSVGVIDQALPMKNGNFRKYRFASLGLFGEWQIVMERWEREKEVERVKTRELGKERDITNDRVYKSFRRI